MLSIILRYCSVKKWILIFSAYSIKYTSSKGRKPKSYKLFKVVHLTEEILLWDFTYKGSIHRSFFQYFVNAETTVSHAVCVLMFELSCIYSLCFEGQEEKECVFIVRISCQNEVFVPRLLEMYGIWNAIMHPLFSLLWHWFEVAICSLKQAVSAEVGIVWLQLTSIFVIIWYVQLNGTWHNKLEWREWLKK